jgi:hypothetical protein
MIRSQIFAQTAPSPSANIPTHEFFVHDYLFPTIVWNFVFQLGDRHSLNDKRYLRIELKYQAVQNFLPHLHSRKLGETIHQLVDIYLGLLSSNCSAPLQSRNPLFKNFEKHSNPDRFQNYSDRRDRPIFWIYSSSLRVLSSTIRIRKNYRVPHQGNKTAGAIRSTPPLRFSEVIERHWNKTAGAVWSNSPL